MKENGIDAKDNSAYLLSDSGEYGFEAFQRMRYLRSIDPNLEDYELAAEFGLEMQPQD